MRPVFLKLYGINSYESEQIIDFERLTEAGLFGIFGSTGSGKSTIIDAVTISLFGEMSRQSSRECINSSLNEMYVSFEFELRGKNYVAERFFTRNNDKIKQKRARLYEKNGAVLCDKPSDMNDAVIGLLGLNYKDFSRSVVLPQNKFSEFLMLAQRDRNDMLERIFGLEEYGDRLLRKLSNIKKTYEADIAIVENGMTYYGDLTREKIAELETSVSREQLTLEGLKESKERLQIDLEQAKKVLSHRVELESLNRQLDLLKEKGKEIENKRERLKVAGISMIIMPFIKSSEDCAARVIKLEATLEKQKLTCEKAEKALVSAQTASEEALSQKDKALPGLISLEARINQAIEIATELTHLNKERKGLLAAYKTVQTDKICLEKKHEAELKNRDNGRLELQKLSDRKKEINISPEKRRGIMEMYAYAQEAGKLEARIKTMDKRLTQLKKDKEVQFKESEEIKERLEKASGEKKTFSDELDRLNRDRPYIHELRKMLTEGEPCPVCGSKEHIAGFKDKASDNVMTATEWEQKKSEIEKRITELESVIEMQRERMAGLQGRYGNNEIQYNETLMEREGLNDEKKRLEALVEVVCGKKTAAQIFDELTAKDKELSEINERETALRKEVDSRSLEIETLNKEITGLSGKLSVITASGCEKKEQIAKLEERVHELAGDKNPAEYIDEIRREISVLNKKAEETKAAALAAADNLRLLKGEYETRSGMKEALSKTLEDENAKITELLIKYGMPNREAVKEGFTNKPEILEQEIKEYDNRVRDLGANIIRVKQELPETVQSAEELSERAKALEADYVKVTDEAERKTESLAVSRERLVSMRVDIKKLESLQRRKKKIEHELDIISELSGLFRGNDFVKYISKRHLLSITTEASRRLREMSRGRYALEFDETTFVIRDDYNGGSRRSPHSLSGGEVFMVSLCLALALSSGIQLKNNAPLEFFFLDEGFGSLDGSTLDTVMNCLEKLRSEKMSVGIISHVDELKNRVPVKLDVRYSAATGSTVEQGD